MNNPQSLLDFIIQLLVAVALVLAIISLAVLSFEMLEQWRADTERDDSGE